MEPITLRVPTDLLEELSQEAEELGYSSRSEYIRHVLRGRNDTEPITQPITDVVGSTTEDVAGPTTDDYSELADRVTELERRVDQLEPVDTETDTEATESDVVQWVQSNQPVSKSDIIAACYPSDSPLNERSWWDTRAREQLKDAGYSYTRNVGWQLE